MIIQSSYGEINSISVCFKLGDKICSPNCFNIHKVIRRIHR